MFNLAIRTYGEVEDLWIARVAKARQRYECAHMKAEDQRRRITCVLRASGDDEATLQQVSREEQTMRAELTAVLRGFTNLILRWPIVRQSGDKSKGAL